MPYKLKGNCVYKREKKIGCSETAAAAKKYLAVLQKKHKDKELEEIIKEIKDYFSLREDKEYLKYDRHKYSSIDCLTDPDCDAPWDEEYREYHNRGKRGDPS